MPPERVYGTDVRLSFVGHVTVLLQTGGINILTDPIWSDRASPVQWAGPRRVHPPGIDFAVLPPIDVVLVSHNHYDHLDLPTITSLCRQHPARVIVPLGNDRSILRYDPSVRVTAYDWGQGSDISSDVRVELRPMHHWSARGLFDRNKALWGAYVITTPRGTVYFAGDTGYGGGDFFRMAKQEFGRFFLALLPIGCSKPEWLMHYQHMGPTDAVKAYYDLGEPFVLPTHHSMFPLADNGYSDPLDNLALVLSKDDRARKRFIRLAAGETYLFTDRKQG